MLLEKRIISQILNKNKIWWYIILILKLIISIKITNSKINLNIVKIPDNIEEKMKILIFVNFAL